MLSNGEKSGSEGAGLAPAAPRICLCTGAIHCALSSLTSAIVPELIPPARGILDGSALNRRSQFQPDTPRHAIARLRIPCVSRFQIAPPRAFFCP